MTRGIRASLPERLAAFSAPTADGCIRFTGALLRGYGRIGDGDGRVVAAHRAAYELRHGSVPDGLELDHLCHTRDLTCVRGYACPHRRCINPDHLEPVTSQEHRRRNGNQHKTHCKRGHPYDETNTYWMPRNAGRDCKTCRKRRSDESRHRPSTDSERYWHEWAGLL